MNDNSNFQVNHKSAKEVDSNVKSLVDQISNLKTAISAMKKQTQDAFEFDLKAKNIKTWINENLCQVANINKVGDLKKQKEAILTHKVGLKDHLATIDDVQKLAMALSLLTSIDQEKVKSTITHILESWQDLNDQILKEDSRISKEFADLKLKEEEALKAKENAAIEQREKDRVKQKADDESWIEFDGLCAKTLKWLDEKKAYLRSDQLQCDLYSVASVQKKMEEFLLEVSSNSSIITKTTDKAESLVKDGHPNVIDIKTKSAEVAFAWTNLQGLMKAKRDQVTKEARLEAEAKLKAEAESADSENKRVGVERMNQEKIDELNEKRKLDEEKKFAELEEIKAKREAEAQLFASENERKLKLIEERRREQKKLEDDRKMKQLDEQQSYLTKQQERRKSELQRYEEEKKREKEKREEEKRRMKEKLEEEKQKLKEMEEKRKQSEKQKEEMAEQVRLQKMEEQRKAEETKKEELRRLTELKLLEEKRMAAERKRKEEEMAEKKRREEEWQKQDDEKKKKNDELRRQKEMGELKRARSNEKSSRGKRKATRRRKKDC